MLLEDEQHVIKWLSQYGALPKTQLVRLLKKPKNTCDRILRNLRKARRIDYVRTGDIGLDPLDTPDPRTICAIWVLLQFIERIEPMAHYPGTYPSQVFFLKENVGYEIVVIYDGELHLLRMLQPSEALKYIIVVPDVSVLQDAILPDAPCLFATVSYPESDEPIVLFYTEEVLSNGGGQSVSQDTQQN